MTVDLRTSRQIKDNLAAYSLQRKDIIGRGTWAVIQNEDLLEELNTKINAGLDELAMRGDLGTTPTTERVTA
jgi:hypothetical protein